MAGCSFKLDVSSLKRRLQKARQMRGEQQKLMKAIGEAMVSSTIQRFNDGVGPDGKEWTPSRRAKAEGGQTLVKSAALKNSHVYEASHDTVYWGPSGAEAYAAIHQSGGMAGRGRKVKIPARPYLGINDEDMAEIRALMFDFMCQYFKP